VVNRKAEEPPTVELSAVTDPPPTRKRRGAALGVAQQAGGWREWAQSQSRPPLRQTYAYATKTVSRKSTISSSPNHPANRENATAHG